MTWLQELSDQNFEKLMIFIDKNTLKLTGTTIKELIKEFERRKMLTPDRKGGIAMVAMSYLLKIRMYAMLNERGGFKYNVDALKEFFNVKVSNDKKTRRKKRKKKEKIDYVERLKNMTALPRKKKKRRNRQGSSPGDEAKDIYNRMYNVDELTPFKGFLNGNESRAVLNLLVRDVCHGMNKREFKVVSDDKNIINLYNAFVMGI